MIYYTQASSLSFKLKKKKRINCTNTTMTENGQEGDLKGKIKILLQKFRDRLTTVWSETVVVGQGERGRGGCERSLRSV